MNDIILKIVIFILVISISTFWLLSSLNKKVDKLNKAQNSTQSMTQDLIQRDLEIIAVSIVREDFDKANNTIDEILKLEPNNVDALAYQKLLTNTK